VMGMRKTVLGEEHPYTLRSVSNLALVLQYQGKYEEVEMINQRALDGIEKVLGEEHRDALKRFNNLASALQRQDKYEEARSMSILVSVKERI